MDRGQADKFAYFMERTAKDFAEIKEQNHELSEKVDKLWEFRIFLIGASFTISSLATLAINMLFLYFGVHK